MAQAGISLFDIGNILGHGSPVVTARYAHYAPEAGRAAIDRLGEAFDGREDERHKVRETA